MANLLIVPGKAAISRLNFGLDAEIAGRLEHHDDDQQHEHIDVFVSTAARCGIFFA
jgi:hypothetical protein